MQSAKPKQTESILKILHAGINAVLPNNLIHSILKKDGRELWIAGKCYSLESKHISLVGFGKAVIGMARAVQDVLDDDLHSGILSIPIGTIDTLHSAGKSNIIPMSTKIKIYEGAYNNLPDNASKKAADEILKFALQQEKNDLLVVLISGGGSALLPAPIPPITLEEKHQITKLLSNRGADIIDLNTVRRRLSNVKGGKLALAAWPAQVISLILSDVIGDSLVQIASGPTVPTQDGPDDAMKIIKKFGLIDNLPASVRSILETEVPQTAESIKSYDHVTNHLIGSNAKALQEAQVMAEDLEYEVCNLSTTVQGEAKEYGKLLAEISKFIVEISNGNDVNHSSSLILEFKMVGHGIDPEKLAELQLKAKNHSRLAILSGGETVVHVTGNGCGGRNQELALAYSAHLHKIFVGLNSENFNIVFLSAGTDGQDGPTNAAGAIAYFGQLTECDTANEFLLDNNSNTFYKKFKPNDLIVTGITGTNVMDIHVILIEKLL